MNIRVIERAPYVFEILHQSDSKINTVYVRTIKNRYGPAYPNKQDDIVEFMDYNLLPYDKKAAYLLGGKSYIINKVKKSFMDKYPGAVFVDD